MTETAVTHRVSTEGADLLTLAGVNDANLVELARLSGARLALRGDQLSVTGAPASVDRAVSVAQRMVELARQREKPTVEINPGTTRVSRMVTYRLAMGAATALDAIWSRYSKA